MVGNVTTGSSFGGLATYLTGKPERVAWMEPRWLLGTDPQEIAREMEAAAGQSSRVEKPVYHLSLSFDAQDQPTRERMREAAVRVLDRLGLGEHQALLVAHNDTPHPHVHVMVNRVHPETGRAWDMGHDYARIEQVLRSLEKEWGLTRVAGHHARADGLPAPDRTATRTMGEIRRTRRTGEAPFPDVVRARLGAGIAKARSWAELARLLEQHGLRVEARGRGLVITDGRRYAKASSVDREAGLPRLERRFGQPLSSYLAEDRTPAPHHGASRPANGGARGADDRGGATPDEGMPGRPSGTPWNVYGVLGALRGVTRMQEEPEKEVPERAGRVALQAAEAFLRKDSLQRPLKDPLLADVVREVQAYGKVRQQETALERALQSYHEAETALRRLPDLERRASELSTAFDRELGRVYRDPDAARMVFEKLAGKEGPGPAADRLRHAPEAFGALRQAEQRGWLRRLNHGDEAPARSAARSAADVGAQYLQAQARMPSETEQARWRTTLQAQRAEAVRLKQALSTGPRSQHLQQRIGAKAQGLTPQQMRHLHQVLTPGQVRLVLRAVGKLVEPGKGRGR